ncbi:DUF4240 domain-containing protein [Microbispora sp. NEAU-D428]|uniref:DUF4240 domain-containing protein n=1 Tax=Microbispora sitophila TaxID=2771537 RepID=UPI00186684F4|nr:DUF4240 domain-containing protein [Microbispora sitophila]MBE3010379.1 DUF4240 domain-containing protein [Microbispora sitophila]
MDIDEFWHLIEQSGRESEGKEARLAWLRERLARRSAEEIADFEEWLWRARMKVDTWLMWGAMRALFFFGSNDGFWYFQMWLVGLGREAFERVASEPDALADLPEVRRLVMKQREGLRSPDMDLPYWTADDWPEFECLDYVAGDAWEQATGTDREGLYDAMESRGHRLYSDPRPTDEEWELDSWEETARRLPRVHRYMTQLFDESDA